MCTMELSAGDGAQGLTVDQNWEVMDEYQSQMYWGSIPRSMFTLFNFILLAECSEFLRPLFFTNPAICVVLMLFIFMYCLGVANVVVGVIVENVLKSAEDLKTEESLHERGHKINSLIQ